MDLPATVSRVSPPWQTPKHSHWPDLRLAFHSPSPTLSPTTTSFDSYLPLPPPLVDSRRLSARSPYAWSTASTSSTFTDPISPPIRPHSALAPLPSRPPPQPLKQSRPVSAPAGTLPQLKKRPYARSPPRHRSLVVRPPSVPVPEIAFSDYDLGTAFASFLEDIACGETSAKQAQWRPPSRRVRAAAANDDDSLASRRTSSIRPPLQSRWSGFTSATEADSDISMLCSTAAILEGRWRVGEVF
ncbi:hypothetical protein JCM6882_009529 [Rhodosporidiobolus microsporus]